MMAYSGGRRLRLAVGVYDALLLVASPHLTGPLTRQEEELVHRKRSEARSAICAAARDEYAARLMQRIARGASARRFMQARRYSQRPTGSSTFDRCVLAPRARAPAASARQPACGGDDFEYGEFGDGYDDDDAKRDLEEARARPVACMGAGTSSNALLCDAASDGIALGDDYGRQKISIAAPKGRVLDTEGSDCMAIHVARYAAIWPEQAESVARS